MEKERRRLVIPAGNGGGIPLQVALESIPEEYRRQWVTLFNIAMSELIPKLEQRLLERMAGELERAQLEAQADVDELRQLAASRTDEIEAVNAWRDQDAVTFSYEPEEHEEPPPAEPRLQESDVRLGEYEEPPA